VLYTADGKGKEQEGILSMKDSFLWKKLEESRKQFSSPKRGGNIQSEEGEGVE